MTQTAPEALGAGVVKRSTRMADGRELIYYDDPESREVIKPAG